MIGSAASSPTDPVAPSENEPPVTNVQILTPPKPRRDLWRGIRRSRRSGGRYAASGEDGTHCPTVARACFRKSFARFCAVVSTAAHSETHSASGMFAGRGGLLASMYAFAFGSVPL